MRNSFVAAIGVLATSGSAMAAEPNFDYTYLQGEYHAHDFDGENGNGYQLEGHFSFGENFFIVATATEAETDVNEFVSNWGDTTFGTNIELDLDYELNRKDFAVGIGGALPLGSRLDLIAQAMYVESELTQSLVGGRVIINYLWNDDPPLIQSACTWDLCETTSIDDQGFATSIGLRGKASERIELYGNLTYYNVNLDNINLEPAVAAMNADNMTFEVGTRVMVIENLLLSLGYAKQEEIESLRLGVRFAL
ncbi:MAG TPA: outer membrane beta-barrel protein [Gammaproteobacteria bacterium]